MGPEPPALQLGPGPCPKGTRPRHGRQFRARLEYRRGEARVAQDGRIYHRHRPGRPGDCSGRYLMSVASSDAVLAKCALFRGMTAAESQELRSLLDPKSYTAGETILAEG